MWATFEILAGILGPRMARIFNDLPKNFAGKSLLLDRSCIVIAADFHPHKRWASNGQTYYAEWIESQTLGENL
jgi:hypothetical protein